MVRAGVGLQLGLQLGLPTQLDEKTIEMPLGEEKYSYLSWRKPISSPSLG